MIMLDTHVLLWWAAGERAKLSAAAQAILYPETPIGRETQSESSITVLEIARLVHGGRLRLAMDLSTWLASAQTIPGILFVPVDNEIAMKAVHLPGVFHKDPVDRIIVATARRYGAPLVTADQLIREYPNVQTVW